MKAYEILSRPDRWTQRVAARDADGDHVLVTSEFACKFCILGALARKHGVPLASYNEFYLKDRDTVSIAIGGDVGSWNDDPNRTFSEVHRLLKKLDI